MSKTILIAGKDAPAGSAFASSAAGLGRNVLITVPLEEQNAESDGTAKKLVWNRPSPASARSLIVQSENAYRTLDEALLIFDVQHFAPRFAIADAACFTRAVDEMMLGYFYLACELVQRFSKQTNPFELIFLLKTLPQGEFKQALPVAIAQAAFASLAENLAAHNTREDALHATLVRDEGISDTDIAAWLFPFLDSGGKKKSAAWIKTGAKSSGIFQFLR